MTDKLTYIQHSDTRKNNPTIENRSFLAKDEAVPYAALYPRDPSLDPQLVWKGKDEQDREDLSVPTVPIYIQEKIQPAAIIDDLRRRTADANVGAQMGLDLFADFNGIDSFEKEIEFYQHDKHWANRMILGDSLLVMNSLAEKEGLKGKVQCIYIDPPYGIKFGSNWQVSTRKRDVKDGKAEDVAREPEVVKAFRDTWKLGIHSYLSYLRDRFRVAQELLTETGSIFVQIGDENVHLVRCVLDEVFGSENFCGQITFKKTSGTGSDLIDLIADHIIWYARRKDSIKFRRLYLPKEAGSVGGESYRLVETQDGARRPANLDDDPAAARFFRGSPLTSERPAQGADLREFTYDGKRFTPGRGTFKTDRDGLERLAAANRLYARNATLEYVRYVDDFPVLPLASLWFDTQSGSGMDKMYVVQTNTKVIERCLLMTTDPGDLVLDPTCGSGTTAYVAEQWGRRWITTDTSRVALALARTRLMSARFPYYLLADSADGVKKESELTGIVPPSYATTGEIKHGFVYKRVPHVTLKSIANNPDIREGMTREQIDVAIAKHAETELLYDKPYEDAKRVRVTGPFTVESLSPHRVLPADAEVPSSEEEGKRDAADDFVGMVLENLRKAGVQNTKKGERLIFDDLQGTSGKWIQAKGTYTADGGVGKRVAVSVGPEYGAVSPMQIREAAKEAMLGIGYDVLVVCGYAFDPHVSDEATRYGDLTVLPARMNADLSMADELLKKTGAGNLFMVFGEPDIDVRAEPNGEIICELSGLDVFDPTTGEIRSDSTDEIACWFIDTNYNGESFFVRHAYFTGADEPYAKLKKALRSEVDEAAWSSLYSTASRPFPKPETGKIAVKVINHYGDEVLKVYDVA